MFPFLIPLSLFLPFLPASVNHSCGLHLAWFIREILHNIKSPKSRRPVNTFPHHTILKNVLDSIENANLGLGSYSSVYYV